MYQLHLGNRIVVLRLTESSKRPQLYSIPRRLVYPSVSLEELTAPHYRLQSGSRYSDSPFLRSPDFPSNPPEGSLYFSSPKPTVLAGLGIIFEMRFREL